MLNFKFNISVFCIILFISGCGHNMALKKDQDNITLSKKSIVLLYVKTSNQVNPSFQFDLGFALICPPNQTCRTRPYCHFIEEPFKRKADQFNIYLLSFELKPGTYNFQSLSCYFSASAFFVAGEFVPLNFEIEIKPNSVVYLGHIDIVLRQRRDKSEKLAFSPSILSGVYGSVVGSTIFGEGTWDVIVEDRFEEDINIFEKEYTALRDINVEKAILPQWTRPVDR